MSPIKNGSNLESNWSSHLRPISFISVKDPFFETNLGMTSLWQNRHDLPHQWLLLDNVQGVGIAALYAQAQANAAHPLQVFVHPDVLLPEDWYSNFMLKLARIESFDSNWGVLGTAGVPLDWTPFHLWGKSKIASSISDFFNNFNSGSDNMSVQSLDEHLLVLRKGSPSFDPNLPGFDLYGTDIVCSARKAGMKAYLLNTALRHKTVGTDGNPFNAAAWWAKFYDPSFISRASTSKVYLQSKWNQSGFLPVYGTAFDVPPWAP